MSRADWLHLIVLLQIPGFLVGWLGARLVHREKRR